MAIHMLSWRQTIFLATVDIKIKEIRKAGYKEYVIKDVEKRELNKIDNEFSKLCRYLKVL